MVERRTLHWVLALLVAAVVICNSAYFVKSWIQDPPEQKVDEDAINQDSDEIDIFWLMRMSQAKKNHGGHTYAPKFHAIPDRVHNFRTAKLPWFNFTLYTGTQNRHLGPITSVRFHWPMKFPTTDLPHNEEYIYLNLSSILARSHEKYLGGELLVYHHDSPQLPDYPMRVELLDVTNRTMSNTARSITQLVNNFNQSRWLTFDISDWLATHRNNSNEIVKLHLNTIDHLTNTHLQQDQHRIRVRRSTDQSEWSKTDAHLVTYHRNPRSASLDADDQDLRADKTRHKRRERRRNAYGQNTYDRRYVTSTEHYCQRRDFNVTFKTLKWDEYIFAPHVYEAGLCSGICPLPLGNYYNSTNHALIQLHYQQIHKLPGIPPPCCVPVRTKFERLLVKNPIDGFVELKHFPDMIVVDCGCR